MSNTIPYLNLQALNDRFHQDDLDAMKSVLNSGQVIGGPVVEEFENAFAAFCNVKYCVSTGNGHDALTAILKADHILDVLPDKARILVPAHTYIATFLSIVNAGMIPVPTDVNDLVLTVDDIITQIDLVDAIICVDIYGKMVGEEVYAFAKANNKPIYCDTAQSHGASNASGKVSGSLARASAFSFYPTKNLGALGDAGAVTTNNELLASTVKQFCNYGRKSRYVNNILGVNSRMDSLQAGFLLNRLPTLTADNRKRKEIALIYRDQIVNSRIQLPKNSFYEHNVFHVYPIYVNNREEFKKYMHDHGIEISCHYEIPPHQQEVFEAYKWGPFHNTEEWHRTEVSIPCHPLLDDEEVTCIVDVINGY